MNEVCFDLGALHGSWCVLDSKSSKQIWMWFGICYLVVWGGLCWMVRFGKGFGVLLWTFLFHTLLVATHYPFIPYKHMQNALIPHNVTSSTTFVHL